MADDPATHLKTGLAAAAKRHWPEALAAFEKASGAGAGPTADSWLGYCVARERGQQARGIALCRAALDGEPRNPLHHFLLGRILLMAGDKEAAIDSFRHGMECGGTPELRDALDALGTRRKPVFPALSRRNPVNKLLGKLRTRLGGR